VLRDSPGIALTKSQSRDARDLLCWLFGEQTTLTSRMRLIRRLRRVVTGPLAVNGRQFLRILVVSNRLS